MTDIEMLPLPDDVCDALQDWRDAAKPSITDATAIHGHIQDYARAVAEHNVKALQEELDNRWAQGVHTCHDKCQRIACVLRRERDAAVKCAERLAEALRVAMDWNWLDDDARPSRVADLCEAALRDHDQEVGNG